uniref:Uncharacterized protein n=1 Tax=Oryza rufipogon TaxID=4529 RepID=A0A0E0Q0S1_ORYRU
MDEMKHRALLLLSLVLARLQRDSACAVAMSARAAIVADGVTTFNLMLANVMVFEALATKQWRYRVTIELYQALNPPPPPPCRVPALLLSDYAVAGHAFLLPICPSPDCPLPLAPFLLPTDSTLPASSSDSTASMIFYK